MAVYRASHQDKMDKLMGAMNPVGLGDTILKEMSARAHKEGFGETNDLQMNTLRQAYSDAEAALQILRIAAKDLDALHRKYP